MAVRKVKDPCLIWVSGWPTFSINGQMILWAILSLSQLLNSAMVARKQPVIISKQITMLVFYSNCIYKQEWARFGLWGVVC